MNEVLNILRELLNPDGTLTCSREEAMRLWDAVQRVTKDCPKERKSQAEIASRIAGQKWADEAAAEATRRGADFHLAFRERLLEILWPETSIAELAAQIRKQDAVLEENREFKP